MTAQIKQKQESVSLRTGDLKIRSCRRGNKIRRDETAYGSFEATSETNVWATGTQEGLHNSKGAKSSFRETVGRNVLEPLKWVSV